MTTTAHLSSTDTTRVIRSPLRHLDRDAVSEAAKRESRNREHVLPPVTVYRWWARRTEAVTGALVDAAAADSGQDRLVVSDPFAGGGVIPLAAARRGHQVYAQDLNSWAVHGLRSMMSPPDLRALRDGFAVLQQRADEESEAAYGTRMSDGEIGWVSHTFRVAVSTCGACGHRHRLFPHALVSLKARAERGAPGAFVACTRGHLFDGDRHLRAQCPECGELVDPARNYTARREVVCPDCGASERLSERAAAYPFDWDVVLVERSDDHRRELALPRPSEVLQADDARWTPGRDLGVIATGQETSVLLRHGFSSWNDLYPRRQRWMTERLLEHAADASADGRVNEALTLAIIGTTEMAGHLSRWDRYYLKSYESMANHRFNFTTFTAEPNVWGTPASGRGTVRRRVSRLMRALEWWSKAARPPASHPVHTSIDGERFTSAPDLAVVLGSSERQLLPDGSCDLVLTDPPYHDDVQYSELSLPLRVWAGLPSSDAVSDVAVNPRVARDEPQSHLLSRIFAESRRTLRADGHLIFSFANRNARAWVELISSLSEAGYRAAGAEILHSENESDHAKRNVRACTMDLILDLVPQGPQPVAQHVPRPVEGEEGSFLGMVAKTVLRIGALPSDWESAFVEEFRAHPFIDHRRRAEAPDAGPTAAP